MKLLFSAIADSDSNFDLFTHEIRPSKCTVLLTCLLCLTSVSMPLGKIKQFLRGKFRTKPEDCRQVILDSELFIVYLDEV
jgi:hypothetical protein